jgi:hypothetical protein
MGKSVSFYPLGAISERLHTTLAVMKREYEPRFTHYS